MIGTIIPICECSWSKEFPNLFRNYFFPPYEVYFIEIEKVIIKFEEHKFETAEIAGSHRQGHDDSLLAEGREAAKLEKI